MKSAKPKLVPTLVCFTVVGMFAAILPYPAFERQNTTIVNPPTETTAAAPKAP